GSCPCVGAVPLEAGEVPGEHLTARPDHARSEYVFDDLLSIDGVVDRLPSQLVVERRNPGVQPLEPCAWKSHGVQAIRVAQLKPRNDVRELRGVAIGNSADVDCAGLHSVGGLLGVAVFAELDDVRVADWL